MSKWLIECYPVYPAEHLEVHNLDVLEYKDYCSKNYQEEVKERLDDFNYAVKRNGVISSNMTHYNNSTLAIVEAETVKDALIIFFGEDHD